MALPTSKHDLADWILRRLGAPVIQIEIADSQLEDCIDEAVQWYQNWHFDGAERAYRLVNLKDVLAANQVKTQLLSAPLYDSSTKYGTGYDSEDAGDYVLDGSDYILYDSDQHAGMQRFEYVNNTRVMYQKSGEGRDSSQPRYIYLTNPKKGVFSGISPLMDLKSNYNDNDYHWVREEVALNDEDLDVLEGQGGKLGIRVPDDVIAITKCHRIDNFSQAGIYNYEYQYFLNNFDYFYGNKGGGGLMSYYIQKTHVDFIEFMLNTQPAIRFNKHKNRLWIDTDWKRLKRTSNSDGYLLLEVYEVTDPEVFGQVYQDMWLKRYATALAKQQWGSNLKKYEGTELPGGVTINGQQIFDEAREEIQTLEEDLRQNLQLEMDSIIWG